MMQLNIHLYWMLINVIFFAYNSYECHEFWIVFCLETTGLWALSYFYSEEFNALSYCPAGRGREEEIVFESLCKQTLHWSAIVIGGFQCNVTYFLTQRQVLQKDCSLVSSLISYFKMHQSHMLISDVFSSSSLCSRWNDSVPSAPVSVCGCRSHIWVTTVLKVNERLVPFKTPTPQTPSTDLCQLYKMRFKAEVCHYCATTDTKQNSKNNNCPFLHEQGVQHQLHWLSSRKGLHCLLLLVDAVTTPFWCL